MLRSDYRRRRNMHGRKSSKLKKGLLFVLRIFIGSIFLFSGFVKAIDPLGTAYKIEEYLISFGSIFEFLFPLSLVFSILLCSFELIVGFNLIFKLYTKTTNAIAFIFMALMTVLTLYIAIKNPVTDCGCFGDAVKLSNTQTFLKNLIILCCCLLLLRNKERSFLILPPQIQAFFLLFFMILSIGFSVYSANRLPLIDFRPYKIGVNIQDAMQIPEGAPRDRYAISFIYEKDGEQKEFSTTNYPKNDSTWVFVDQKQTLLSKGYQPPIYNFKIEDENFDDMTESILNYEADTYLLIAYDLKKAKQAELAKAEQLYNKTKFSNKRFYALTASSDEEIALLREKTGISYPFYRLDPITLKTIIRSNPGIVLLKKGTIQKKWHWKDFNWE